MNKKKVAVDELAKLTGVVRRCNRAAECTRADCPHKVLHEHKASCGHVGCGEFAFTKCVAMYGGEKVTETDQGDLKRLRICCNCGDIQETGHMRYREILRGWLCSACNPYNQTSREAMVGHECRACNPDCRMDCEPCVKRSLEAGECADVKA